MAKMAEDMARVAGGIRTGHKRRSELAMEIKVATQNRRSDVDSFLKSLKTSRNKATRERMAEASKVVRARHKEVEAWLKSLTAARGKAGSEQQKEAMAMNKERQSNVKALMNEFHHEDMARRKHFHEAAAAFMKNLTSGVAALLDGFDKLNRDRAMAVRERFAIYAADRHDAMAVWSGSHKEPLHATHRPAGTPAHGHAEPSAPTSAPGAPHFPAQPMGTANPSSRREPFVNMGHSGSKEPHKGGSK